MPVRLFGLDPEDDRFRIRGLRSRPPGWASKDADRRHVFSASLGQFDELLTAAAAVGPASRPLPLYYALNQAGRAIAAARQDPPQPWEPKSHGLHIGDPESDFLGELAIDPAPRKDGRDSFGILARATGRPPLVNSVMLLNVWAAIPGCPSPASAPEHPGPCRCISTSDCPRLSSE